MGINFLLAVLFSAPLFADNKCPTEQIFHDKVEALARSKPMERHILLNLIKSECPGRPDADYNRMLQVVAGEGAVELCLRSYFKDKKSLFFDLECRAKNLNEELLARDAASNWDKIIVRDQGKGLYKVMLGNEQCRFFSMTEKKINSIKKCSEK